MTNNDYLELKNQQKNNEIISEFKSFYSKLVKNKQSEWERDFVLLDAYEKWMRLKVFRDDFCSFLVELCEEVHEQEKIGAYSEELVEALKKDELLAELFSVILSADNKFEEIKDYLLTQNDEALTYKIIEQTFSEEDNNVRKHSITKFNKYKEEFRNRNVRNTTSFVTTVRSLAQRVSELELYIFYGDAFENPFKSPSAYKIINIIFPKLFREWIQSLGVDHVNKNDEKEVFDYFINYSENEFKDILAAKPSGNFEKEPTEEKKRLKLKKQIRSAGLRSVLSYFEKGEKSDVSLSEVTQEFAKSVKSNEAYLRLSTKYLIQLWSENKNRPDSNVIPKISRQYFPAQHIDEAISFTSKLSSKSDSLYVFLNNPLNVCSGRIQRYIFDGTSFDPCLESIVKNVFGEKERVLGEFEKTIKLEYEKFNNSLGQELSVDKLTEFANYSVKGKYYEFFRNNCLIHAFILAAQNEEQGFDTQKLALKAFEYEKAFLLRSVFLYRIIDVHCKSDSLSHKELVCEKYYTYKRDAYSLARVLALVSYQIKCQNTKKKPPKQLSFEAFSSKFLKKFFDGILPISNKALVEQRRKQDKGFSVEFQTLCTRVGFVADWILDFPLENLLELNCISLLNHSAFKELWKKRLNKEQVLSILQENNLDIYWQKLVGRHAEDLAYYGYIDDLLDTDRLYSTNLQGKRSGDFIAVVKNGNYLGEYIKKLAKNSIRSVRDVLLGFDESLSERLKSKLDATSNILNLGDERYKLALNNELKPIALGKGGFGCVYKAFDEKLNCTVAIKLIPKWSHALELEQKMLNEAVVMRQCRHENVVTLYDVYTFQTSNLVIGGAVNKACVDALYRDSNIHGLVMEYIDDARTLKDYVSDPNSGFHEFSFKEKLELFIDICKGVEQAHLQSSQVIHGDIKPENILIDKDGVPKLTDFGISSSAGSQSVGSSGVIYSSINIIEGNPAKVQDDIYSLGMVLLYILFPKLIKEPRLRENLFDSQQELIHVLVLLDSVCNAYWDEKNENGLVFDDEGTLYGDLEEVITKIPRLSCSMLFDGVIQIIRTDYPYGIEVDWPIKAILKAIVYQQSEEALLDIKEVLSRSSKDYFSNSYESVLEFRCSIASLSGSNVTFSKRVKFGGTLVSRSNLSIVPTEEIFDEDFPKNVGLNEVTVLSISNDFNIGFAKHPQLGEFKFSLPKEPKIKEKLQDLRTLSEYFYKPNQLILETASLLFKKGFDNQAYRNLVVLLFEGNELIKLNCVDERLANLQLSKVHSGFYSRSTILAPLIKKITEISEAIIAQNKFTAFVAEINSLPQELIKLVCKCYERADSLQEFHQSTKNYSKYGISSWAELIYAPNAVVIRKYITQVLDRIHWNGYSHNSLRKKSYTLKNWEILTLLLESSLHDGSEFLMQSIVSEFFENGAYRVLESDLESVGHILLGEPRFSVYEQCLNCLSRVEVM